MLKIIVDAGIAVVSLWQCIRQPAKNNLPVEDVKFAIPFLAAVVAFRVNIVVFNGSRWTLFDGKLAEFHKVSTRSSIKWAVATSTT